MKWDEMKPRERDALVAEKVMGHTIEWRTSGMDGSRWAFIAWNKELPCYTTDISAAWEVVGKFEDSIVQQNCEGKAYATLYLSNKPAGRSEWCESASEAICKAALKAVGVDIE